MRSSPRPKPDPSAVRDDEPGAFRAPGSFVQGRVTDAGRDDEPDSATSLPADLPLSLYVHLPWCERKCPYCDFNSYEARGAIDETAYVSALLRDLDAELAAGPAAHPPVSVFIGGGTPSLFSAPAIARLLDGIDARISLGCEITLEANPGSAEASRFAEYRRAGVNRLSIGIQSFRDGMLAAIGRIHSADEARRAVRYALDAGFEKINIDLMYGLPRDDADGALADVDEALAFGASHLSWYQLTLEPGTAFHRKPPELPDDDTVALIEQAGREAIAARGLERYEVSGYARPGERCAHNLNYWQFGDYIGIGAGAHGKRSRIGAGAIERRTKPRHPRTYLDVAGTPAATVVEVVDDPQTLTLECLMGGLRLVDGIDVVRFEAQTGQSVGRLRDARCAAERRGWLDADPAVLRATPEGLSMLNRLLALF